MLCYHAVSPTWGAPLSVSPEALERQVESLIRRGYRGATFSEAVSCPPAERTVAITFDDAYTSVMDVGLPILDRWGMPGTVFVPTDFAGTDQPMTWPGIDEWLGGPHEHELLPLGWNRLRFLADHGWEVGSHTASHPRLSRLDDAALAFQLQSSKTVCERELSTPCRSIAYPYGDVSPRVVSAAKVAGYSFGAALPVHFHAPHPLTWPRVGIYHDDPQWRFRTKASTPVRWARTSAAGDRLTQLIRRGQPTVDPACGRINSGSGPRRDPPP